MAVIEDFTDYTIRKSTKHLFQSQFCDELLMHFLAELALPLPVMWAQVAITSGSSSRGVITVQGVSE